MGGRNDFLRRVHGLTLRQGVNLRHPGETQSRACPTGKTPPGADPRNAGGIISLAWPGNSLGPHRINWRK